MPKTKEPVPIPDLIEAFQKHPLPAKIAALKSLQDIVAMEVAEAQHNVEEYKKINNK